MEGSKVRSVFQICKQLHTLTRNSRPSDTLKKKIGELEKDRRRRNPKRNQLFVETPESLSWLDTASMPMFATVVGIALFAKLLMMKRKLWSSEAGSFRHFPCTRCFRNDSLTVQYEDAHSQERIEKKIQNAPPGQGTVRMLSREEWEEFREVRPRTPFESKLARPNARIRTGEPLHMEDVRDWTIDVLTDALTRAEECVKQGSK